MAEFLRKLKFKGLFLAVFLGAFLAFLPEAYAAFIPLPDATNLDVPIPTGETAIEKAENLIGPFAKSLRIIIGAIAVALIVVAGLVMVVAGDNEETVKTQRKGIIFGVIGLLMISIAGPVAEVFDFRQGNILEDPDQFKARAELFDDATRVLITFIKYFLGSLAALMFMRSGALMIAQGYSEETITREKKNLALAAGGLIVVMVSDLVVRRILYDTEYVDGASETVVAINQNEMVTQIVAITNLVVTFVAPVMMLGIVIGGILYITAGGDEERMGMAKKILINSVIGIVIIYGAFALVSTVISGIF